MSRTKPPWMCSGSYLFISPLGVMTNTRCSKFWLIWKFPSEDILDGHLPSRQDVLLYYLYQHSELGETAVEETKRTSAKIREIRKLTFQLRLIQTSEEWSRNSWKNTKILRKIRKRWQMGQLWKESGGKKTQLFDIAAADTLECSILFEDEIFADAKRGQGLVIHGIGGLSVCQENSEERRQRIQNYSKEGEVSRKKGTEGVNYQSVWFHRPMLGFVCNIIIWWIWARE